MQGFDKYEQAAGLWKVLGRTPGQQGNFVKNVAGHLSGAIIDVRERTYGMFSRVDADLGRRIRAEIEKLARPGEAGSKL